MIFSLDPEQVAKLGRWEKQHNQNCKFFNHEGAIGGRLTYSFTPTSLGVVTTIECACGEKLDLSDYENW